MKKLICLRWVPASWKSTWAKNEVECNDAIRFNKDDIRKELAQHDSLTWYNQKDFEKVVVEMERSRVGEACVMWEEYIIVDNTHLQYKDWTENKHIAFYKNLAEWYWYEFEIKEFYVSEEVAILRDELRQLKTGEGVGEAVIHKFFRNMKTPTKFPANPIFIPYVEWLPEAIIVDIDWTLAFMNWKRSPYDYTKVWWDRVNEFLSTLLHKLNNHKIIIVSWRKDDCRAETLEWLVDNYVKFDELYMRKSDDNRCDSIVKEEIYREFIEDKYNVFAVFDDRDRVVDMWRRVGLPTYQVWYWDF